MWMLRWTPYALTHGESILFTHHMNFPEGVNLMWNSSVPLPAIALWPVTAWFGPVVAYNTFITLNVAGSAWCAFVMCRRFVTRQAAAFAGGLLFGFSPYMLAQSRDHPTLTALFVPPLVVICLHELFTRMERSPRLIGAVLGLLAACQLLIAEEILAATALATAVGLSVLGIPKLRNRRLRRELSAHLRRLGIAVAVGSAVFGALTFWALNAQFLGDQRLSNGTVHPPNRYISDLLNFVVPTSVQELSPGWTDDMARRWSGNLSEKDAYLGLPLLATIAFVVFRLRRRNPVVVPAVITAGAIALLSMGPNLRIGGTDTGFPLPWRAFGWTPLLGHLLPTRLMSFCVLMLALVLAIGIDHVLGRRRAGNDPPPVRSRHIWATAVAGVAVIATLLPTLHYPANRIAAPEFFTSSAVKALPESGVALVLPYQQIYPADPMLWQSEANMRFRMPQGYFFVPDENGKPRYGAPITDFAVTLYAVQSGFLPPLLAGDVARIATEMEAKEIDSVIVGPMARQDHVRAFFELLFRRPPVETGGVYLWRNTLSLLRTASS